MLNCDQSNYAASVFFIGPYVDRDELYFAYVQGSSGACLWLANDGGRAAPKKTAGDGWPMVGQWLANGWAMVGQWLANGWPMVGQWLANGWPMVGQWLANG